MNRRLLLIVLAVVLAFVGTGVVYEYVHHADQRAIAKTEAAQVLVAVKSVPAGTSWQDATKGGYFQPQKVPVNSAPSLALSSTTASVPLDDVATATIAAGQIVIRPMFGAKTAVVGPLPIPDKDLAVSFTVNGAAAVAGFVQPQSEVAIFVTYDLPTTGGAGAIAAAAAAAASGGKAQPQATKLLFPRVLVLATAQTAPGVLDKANGGGGQITLALTQQQAEQLILASQTSTLYLGLLSDTSVTNADQGVTFDSHYLPVTLAK